MPLPAGSMYTDERIPTMPTKEELDELFAWGRALGITAEQLDRAVREVRRTLRDEEGNDMQDGGERDKKRYIYIVYAADDDGYEEIAAFASEERAKEFIRAVCVDGVYRISKREL